MNQYRAKLNQCISLDWFGYLCPALLLITQFWIPDIKWNIPKFLKFTQVCPPTLKQYHITSPIMVTAVDTKCTANICTCYLAKTSPSWIFRWINPNHISERPNIHEAKQFYHFLGRIKEYNSYGVVFPTFGRRQYFSIKPLAILKRYTKWVCCNKTKYKKQVWSNFHITEHPKTKNSSGVFILDHIRIWNYITWCY